MLPRNTSSLYDEPMRMRAILVGEHDDRVERLKGGVLGEGGMGRQARELLTYGAWRAAIM